MALTQERIDQLLAMRGRIRYERHPLPSPTERRLALDKLLLRRPT